MTHLMFQNFLVHYFLLHHHKSTCSETPVKSMHAEVQLFYSDIFLDNVELEFELKISINNFNKLMLKK